jgi:hypothetical protein
MADWMPTIISDRGGYTPDEATDAAAAAYNRNIDPGLATGFGSLINDAFSLNRKVQEIPFGEKTTKDAEGIEHVIKTDPDALDYYADPYQTAKELEITKPEPTITPEAANALVPAGLGLKFDAPISADLANHIIQDRVDKAKNESNLARFKDNTNPAVFYSAAVLSQFLNPTTDALMLIPGVGEEAIMAKLGWGTGIIGRGVARAISGGTLWWTSRYSE